MRLVINGLERDVAALGEGATVLDLLSDLGLKQDRVAIEQNGAIVPRSGWASAALSDRDRIEMVHFVGGGKADHTARRSRCNSEHAVSARRDPR